MTPTSVYVNTIAMPTEFQEQEIPVGGESTETQRQEWADAAMYRAKELGANRIQFHAGAV
jgi:GGDEF domain-containing protein